MATCWPPAPSAGIALWDLRNPSAPPKTIHEDREVDIIKVAFSPDSQWLIAGATETYHALLFRAPFDALLRPSMSTSG